MKPVDLLGNRVKLTSILFAVRTEPQSLFQPEEVFSSGFFLRRHQVGDRTLQDLQSCDTDTEPNRPLTDRNGQSVRHDAPLHPFLSMSSTR